MKGINLQRILTIPLSAGRHGSGYNDTSPQQMQANELGRGVRAPWSFQKNQAFFSGGTGFSWAKIAMPLEKMTTKTTRKATTSPATPTP